MKTYCKPKDVNVEDYRFNLDAVSRCISGKERRKDFRDMVVSTGVISKNKLNKELDNGEFNKRVEAWEEVAKILTQRIIDRDLKLPDTLVEFERSDNLSGKVRKLTRESPEQQCYEYICVNALMPLFNAKILPCQYGSIPNRGQVVGARQIERIVRRKFRGNIDCVKCDVRHAYNSTSVELIMSLLNRDIGKNKILLWLLGAVMANFPNGRLIIGGYLSTWLFNYIMSYFLRYLLSIVKVRRGIRNRVVKAIVCYADDFVMFGKIKALLSLTEKASKWIQQTFGLQIKQGWQVIRLSSFEEERQSNKDRQAFNIYTRSQGIDMMGYVVRRRYTIIRKRIYKRVRRYLIRANNELKKYRYVPWWRAQQLMSYKGFIKHTCSRLLKRKLNVEKIFRAASKSLSYCLGAKKDEVYA